MSQIDDRSYVERCDPSGMFRLAEAFPSQCRKAIDAASASTLPSLDFNSVVLTGMGGSAAGGDLTQALFDSFGKVPFIVNRDYGLPNFVGPHSLVFAVSYSGNTEETLASYEVAKSHGAKVVVVTSGGGLAEAAKANGDSLVLIPGGQPPRTALGYLFVPVVVCCSRMGLIPGQDFGATVGVLRSCVEEWTVENLLDRNEAKLLALELYRGLGVIYGLGSWQSFIANRWKGQINENAKNMAFGGAYPEICHNEILGWAGAEEQGVARWVGVALEDGTESVKMKKRASVVEGLLADTVTFKHFRGRGESLLSKMLSLALLGDFVSLYLAALNEVDPEKIDAINLLKRELVKVD